MNHIFIYFPDWISGLLFILGSVLLAIVPYAMARYLIGDRADQQSKDLASSVIFRISALHGLILAIVFSQEMLSSNHLHGTAAREATLVGDLYYDLERYGPGQHEHARFELARYTHLVVHEEWALLSISAELSDEAWLAWENAYQHILDLDPTTAREKLLHSQMTASIHEIAGLRQNRYEAAHSGVHPFLTTAAIVGIVLISISYFAFVPTMLNLMLLSIFGAFTGLIVFFIASFSNPFDGPGTVHPIGLENLLEKGMSEMLRN